jgi:hypothetical protein
LVIWGDMSFWRSDIACFFIFLVFLHQSLHIYWDATFRVFFFFTLFFNEVFLVGSLFLRLWSPLPLKGEKADRSNKNSNLKTNQEFKCSKNNWKHQLYPQ